ncbi:MAG: tyrosine-type recombinase/integrase [Butyricicoccus sp.]|nr:tyrosine-type recombinase/integrase [Butyricicoccus sp.]
MFYNKNTLDGCFRKTFSYNGKRYSVQVKTARDLWHKVEEKSSGYLFTQPTTGKPHTETSMKQMWRSFKQALDLDIGAQMASGAIDPETSVVADDLTPYCLRHTYATDLQSADVPINVAKDFLGHKSIAMISQIYTHLSIDAFAEASLKVINFQHAQQRKKKKKSVGNRLHIKQPKIA